MTPLELETSALDKIESARIILAAARIQGLTRNTSIVILDLLRGATANVQELDNLLAGMRPPKQGD